LYSFNRWVPFSVFLNSLQKIITDVAFILIAEENVRFLNLFDHQSHFVVVQDSLAYILFNL
jgi:predicted RNA-binding protein